MNIKKWTLLSLMVFVVFLFAGCDTSFKDGTISVSVSGISNLGGFNIGTSDIYFFAYEMTGSSSIAGTKIDGYSGSSIAQGIGVPSYVFTGGETYKVDVLVDIDGNDNLDDGNVFWLIDYKEVAVDGNETVSVTNNDFILK